MSIRYGSVAELEAKADPGLVPNNPGRLGRRSRSLGPILAGSGDARGRQGEGYGALSHRPAHRAERQVTLKTHAAGSCGSSKGGASAFSGRSFEITNRGVVSGCDFIGGESEATPLAAPSLPYMKRSPQVSHEASNDRTWPRESRRQRAVCPVTDQGARFEGHYVPRRNPATPGIETGEKPMRSLPLAASANGVWFGQLCCTEKYRGHISGVLVACHGSGDRGGSTPGADDHASAVAVLLELAQRLRTTQTENACSLCRLLRLSQRSLGVADRPNRGADGCSKSAQGSSSFGWSYQAGSHAFGDLELDTTPPTPPIADISGIRALPIEVVVDARCYPCRVKSIPDCVAQF